KPTRPLSNAPLASYFQRKEETGSRRSRATVIQVTPNVPKKKSVNQSQKLKDTTDEEIEWLSTDEEEKKQDDDDDNERSIDIEEADDDERTKDEYVHGDEYVHDDVDEEMKDARARKDDEENRKDRC
ncbi:hypothetical protein Tco_0843764, partial [Tanacetum coccineum]